MRRTASFSIVVPVLAIQPSLGQEEMAFEQDLAKLLPQVEPVARSLGGMLGKHVREPKSASVSRKVPDSTWPAGKLMQKLLAYDHEAWAPHRPSGSTCLGLPEGTLALLILSDAMAPAMKCHVDLLEKAGCSGFDQILPSLFMLYVCGRPGRD